MNIESDIRDYIATNLLFSGEGFAHADDASFLREGIIDSLGVMELVTFVGQRFGIVIEPHEVTPDNFDSVRKLAGFIRRKCGKTPPATEPVLAQREIPGLMQVQSSGCGTPLFFLHGDILGGGLYCFPIARELGPNQPFYALPPLDLPGDTIPSLEEIAAEQRRTIQAHTPHGPYILGGFCIGAFVALEIALQLRDQGEAVEQLLIVDPQLPAFLGWFRLLLEFASRLRRQKIDEQLAAFMRGYRRWFRACELLRFGPGFKWRSRSRSGGTPQMAGEGRPATGAVARHSRDLTAAYPWCAAKYRPRRYTGRAALFCCDHPMMTVRSKLRAWRKLVPHATVQVFPGEHLDLVTTNAAHLAAHLCRALDGSTAEERIDSGAPKQRWEAGATGPVALPFGAAGAPKPRPIPVQSVVQNSRSS